VFRKNIYCINKLADDKGMQFECSIQEGLPALAGDSDRMQSVFSNLISNGVKLTLPVGRDSFLYFKKMPLLLRV